MSNLEGNLIEDCIVTSIYYCPNCKSDNLMIQNTKAYMNKKPYYYYCKDCHETFKITKVTDGQPGDKT